MHLKSLTLKGFKSFADRTHLLLEPGVSVVVGPNGSGKSNISDAVLWVLGEQSAKSLRGNSMEDVIFAGSSARKAVGVAEVDLVLDNADHALPLEFDEVTITRRMFRNGESEYLLNSSPCRLMDVHDLLHDSGLGRDTHSIISQGRLDEILNSRPEERRSLIEEAAGVLKHKKRKERALRKLGALDQHISRARDIIAEIDRQLRPLQRQADRAQQHAGLADELRELEVTLAVDDLRRLQTSWDELLKREREQDADIELARYRLEEKERELHKFQSLLEEKGLFVGDLSEQRRRLQSILERVNSGLLLLEEKGKHLIERLSELRAKLHHAETRGAQRTEEIGRIAEERQETDAQLKALYTRLSELRREAEGVRKERLAAEEELGRTNNEIRRSRKETEDRRAELAKLEQALSAMRLEERLLGERDEALRGQRSQVAATLSGRRARLDTVEKSLGRTRKELQLADADVEKRVRVLDSRRKELTDKRDEHAALRAEVRGLEEVDRAFETASPALAWVLSKEREIPGLLGHVGDFLEAPEELERLVEHALGPDLFCVLVTDRAAARDVVGMLERNASGDIALLPIDAAAAPSTPDAPGERVVDRLKFEEGVRPAIEALLGDLRLVGSLEEAMRASAADTTGSRFGTPEGHLVWPNGKVTVGPSADASAGVLTRKRRINELRDEAQATEAVVGDFEALVAEAEEALSAAQQDALELGQRLAIQGGEADVLREEIGRVESQLADLDTEAAVVVRRRKEVAERLEKDAPQRAALAAGIEDGGKRLEQAEENASVAREARDGRFRDEAAVNNRLGQCQVDIATVSEREVHLKRQLASAAADLAELEETAERSRQTEEALELLRERVQPIHDLYSVLLARAEHWAVKLRDRARFEQADSESLRETVHAAQDGIKAVQAEIDAKAEVMSGIRVEKGQLELQVRQAAEHIVEELETPLERAMELPDAGDREKAADRALTLRRRIANLGPVNPVAVEEHRSLAERREFLQGQLEDLSAGKNSLAKVVRAIDRKMRDRFTETFEQVDRHFQQVFAVLFPGGHAALRLTEPDDPEETGVEVVAQPHGKKLTKMTLMSGGEKSLTALALLFALYHTRPCPFYILDEVEAALDDTNLRRFVAFVDSLRGHTQFIVVTHQRRTMEMADVLYGVSMQADGVSKVVSQRLDRNGELQDERSVV